MEQEQFWLNNPFVLMDHRYIANITFFSEQTTINSKLNSMTRLIVLLTVLGYIFTQNTKILISGLLALIAIVILHNYLTKKEGMNLMRSNYGILTDDFKNAMENLEQNPIQRENFTMPKQNNPLMNVMLPEIKYNPVRKEAAPSFNTEVEKDINDNVKKTIDPKLFQDLGDHLEFEHSMSRFYTTSNTTIPNDQKGFAEYCYGVMPSCKEGDGMQCEKKNYRHILM
jgi:hypothetical protein